MTRQDLFNQISRKSSYLCIGLDTDFNKIPACLRSEPDPVFAFNRAIIEATHTYAVSYKPNLAFYEARGPRGLESLQKTLEIIPNECFTIADAKRGDIGNTSSLYATAFFDKQASGFDFDSVTVAPYMGADSVKPFLEFEGKWVILLALTSNPGSSDFQKLTIVDAHGHTRHVFEQVLTTSQQWGTSDQLMYVVGATQTDQLQKIRTLIPDHFLLVPGVGAQGGSLEEVSKAGMNDKCGLLVNSSRAIIYASNGTDFAEKAAAEALKVQQEMAKYLDLYL